METYEINGYLQWIDDERSKSNCTCPDFRYRKLKKANPEDSESKIIQVGECKHLKEARKGHTQSKSKTNK